jgi:hypothetical protein
VRGTAVDDEDARGVGERRPVVGPARDRRHGERGQAVEAQGQRLDLVGDEEDRAGLGDEVERVEPEQGGLAGLPFDGLVRGRAVFNRGFEVDDGVREPHRRTLSLAGRSGAGVGEERDRESGCLSELLDGAAGSAVHRRTSGLVETSSRLGRLSPQGVCASCWAWREMEIATCLIPLASAWASRGGSTSEAISGPDPACGVSKSPAYHCYYSPVSVR